VTHAVDRPRGSLLRVLGVAFSVAVLIGTTIGMGILRTPGEVAAWLPSAPWFLGVWIAGAVYALLGALSVAELATMRPRSGGPYPLVRHALGAYPGFVSGWTDWFATCGTVAAVAMVLGEYVGPLVPALTGREALTASAVVVGFALLQWRGISAGDLTQQATSLLKTVALVALAAVALTMGPSLVTANAPSAALPVGAPLAAAVIVALQSAIYTYDGWTGPVYFGEEVRDPERAIPRAMIGGVLLVGAVYLLLNVAFLRVLSIGEMAGDPFVAASAAARLFGPSGDTVLRCVMIVSLLAAVNANQLMSSRVSYAMSRDGFLPRALQRVNAGGTPAPALVAGTIVALLFIATNTVERALALLAFFYVANYTLLFCALFVLRRREPDAARPFRVPGYPVVPGLALAISAAFLVGAISGDPGNSAIALSFLALSWPAYLGIARTPRRTRRQPT
jgi:APA family basic amino acid/polyamine antiporter